MKNLLGILTSYIFIGIIIMLAKLFEKFGKEASRKFIHISLANWWFIAMYFFDNAIWASLVPLSFVIINYISYKKNLISVMERESQDGLGTVYYALSLLIISIFTFGIIKRPEIGLCSILIMGYADGLAAVIGKRLKSYEYKIGNTKKNIRRFNNNVYNNIYDNSNIFKYCRCKTMVTKINNNCNNINDSRSNINKRNR